MPARDHPGWVIYLTGLPSAGKTTLAHALRDRLAQGGIAVQILDSDEMRRILTPSPGFSKQERNWFYGVLATIAGLLAQNGVNVIIAATAPCRAHREAARSRIRYFAEVYVDCPIHVCRARDPKGLWQQSAAGDITTLPGAGAPYEPPEFPEVRVDTGQLAAQEAADLVIDRLESEGFFQDREKMAA